MQVTVQDIMQLKPLQGLKLLTKPVGLDNVISKVGILEYEFTRQGHAFCTDSHWLPNEFVLTTFGHMKNTPSQMINAVKMLQKEHTSGIAIKNVFQLDIPPEVIRFANTHRYPIFLFTDHSLFFEDVILCVNRLISSVNNQNFLESRIASLLQQNQDGSSVKTIVNEINPFLSDDFQIAYIKSRTDDARSRLPFLLHQGQMLLNEGNSLIKYKKGFFFIRNHKEKSDDTHFQPAKLLSLNEKDYWIGISDPTYFIAHFIKALRQSLSAAAYSQIYNRPISHYNQLGTYQLLLPLQDSDEFMAYYNAMIPPICDYDEQNGSSLFETILLFETYHGNIKEMALASKTHENTIRYRLKKVGELFQKSINDAEFIETLITAVKMYRILSLRDSD